MGRNCLVHKLYCWSAEWEVYGSQIVHVHFFHGGIEPGEEISYDNAIEVSMVLDNANINTNVYISSYISFFNLQLSVPFLGFVPDLLLGSFVLVIESLLAYFLLFSHIVTEFGHFDVLHSSLLHVGRTHHPFLRFKYGFIQQWSLELLHLALLLLVANTMISLGLTAPWMKMAMSLLSSSWLLSLSSVDFWKSSPCAITCLHHAALRKLC